MRRALKIALAAGASWAAATPAYADTKPTLHGFCGYTAADPACPEVTKGTTVNSPTAVNPPLFGFSAGGHSATGEVLITILLPDNVAKPSSFTFTAGSQMGGGTDTATLVPGSAWTGIKPGTTSTPWTLADYLGLAASPSNPIGAFLPATNTFQPSATGFYVYEADIASATLPANSVVGSSAEDPYLMQLGQSLAQGSYIVAFIDPARTWGATANSGAIFETKRPLPEPSTWAMMLLGFGGIGVVMRRRRKTALPQLA